MVNVHEPVISFVCGSPVGLIISLSETEVLGNRSSGGALQAGALDVLPVFVP